MKKPQCPGCGFREMEHRTEHTETICYGTRCATVAGLSGWFCPECGDALLDEESSRRYGEVGDALILQRREEIKEEVKRIRRKLKLTQKEAAAIFGGGVNAFSRYERGEVEPGPSTIKLLHLLDKHPELLPEIVNH